MCYWGVFACFDGPVNADGEVGGLWFISSMSFTLIIFVVTYKLFLESLHWTWLGMLIGALSIFFYFISVLVLSSTGVGNTF
mmetsp:Transcript_1677/g.182  ORF Transcript_1677/g.182 Transcript_1677/m.182 type:complete len:81 (+) Transcript_1677:2403-2645(+)